MEKWMESDALEPTMNWLDCRIQPVGFDQTDRLERGLYVGKASYPWPNMMTLKLKLDAGKVQAQLQNAEKGNRLCSTVVPMNQHRHRWDNKQFIHNSIVSRSKMIFYDMHISEPEKYQYSPVTCLETPNCWRATIFTAHPIIASNSLGHSKFYFCYPSEGGQVFCLPRRKKRFFF